MGDRICIMSGGHVVQTGRPMDVYRHPADVFVAGFLGSPPMNLIPAMLEGNAIRLGPQSLPTPFGAGRDGPVTFGIRPEDIAIGGPRAPLQARVLTVAPLGAETIVALELPGVSQELLVRGARDVALRSGESVRLACDADAATLFDAVSGRSLAAAERAPAPPAGAGPPDTRSWSA